MAHDTSTPPVIADTLALALVASSDAPIVLLDGDLDVVAASASFARAFQIDPATRRAHARCSRSGTGSGTCRNCARCCGRRSRARPRSTPTRWTSSGQGARPRRLVITAHQLAYGDAAKTRLLLAVSDVTDARLAERLKDDLLREKAILYQELQHRVANSLQIIASVLMQSARRVAVRRRPAAISTTPTAG